jgi:6,7-dimethyl-8-ribityllumazine synthase
VLVVVSRYNASVTDAMLEGAIEAYTDRFHAGASLEIVAVPGAFELTAAARAGALSGRFDGVVALGCIIRGETSHDQYIASALAHGLTSLTIGTGVPVAFGVLTVDTAAQARARAGGKKGNKGREAMDALLDTLDAIRAIEAGEAPSGPRSRVRTIPDKAAARRGAGGVGGMR